MQQALDKSTVKTPSSSPCALPSIQIRLPARRSSRSHVCVFTNSNTTTSSASLPDPKVEATTHQAVIVCMYSIVTLLHQAQAQAQSQKASRIAVCTIAYTHFLTRINLIGRDLRSVGRLRRADACMCGAIEDVGSLDTTRFCHRMPSFHICKRSPLGMTRENPRSTPASSLIDRGTGCEST